MKQSEAELKQAQSKLGSLASMVECIKDNIHTYIVYIYCSCADIKGKKYNFLSVLF